MSHAVDKIRSRLVLRLARAAIAADVADEFGHSNLKSLLFELNWNKDLRRTLLESPTILEVLEPLGEDTHPRRRD